MENMNSRQKGTSSSSSSSIATELFGPKATPSTTVFGSVFGPPPTGRGMDLQGRGMDSSHQGGGEAAWGNHNTSWNQAPRNPKHGGPSNNVASKDYNNTYYQQETTQPCHYSSSIYYGGQDDYSTPGRNTESHQYKKNPEDDGSDESQGQGASRGNWWQGSLYY